MTHVCQGLCLTCGRAMGAEITDEMVERGARTFDGGFAAQLDETYKRNMARAVLRAALDKEHHS